MLSIETYRKQAKLLVRWHRERNYSIGGKVRLLQRYRDLTDVEVLEMAMPLTLAQEVVAVEAGFRASREGGLILATIEVANVKALFQEYEPRSVDFPQRLVRQAWGGLDFHVRDPDGNVISFVQNRRPAPHTEERRE